MTTTTLQELPQLSTLRAAIQAEHDQAQLAAGKAVHHAINAGKLLLQAKSLVLHGDWSQWLVENFRGSPRTARGYMLLANRFESLDDEKRQRVANLPLRSALSMLRGNPKSESEQAEEFSAHFFSRHAAMESWRLKFPDRLNRAATIEDCIVLIDEADSWVSEFQELNLRAQHNAGRLLNELEASLAELEPAR